MERCGKRHSLRRVGLVATTLTTAINFVISFCITTTNIPLDEALGLENVGDTEKPRLEEYL